MIDYEAILKQNPNGVLATQCGSEVRTRIFDYLFIEGNKVYFCTSSKKQVYAQIQANPSVSFCTYLPDFDPVLSINGKVVFVEDMALKTRAFDEKPVIKEIYGGPDNPVFVLFYIDIAEVQTFNYKEGPKTYTV